jgi:hypothetical protein
VRFALDSRASSMFAICSRAAALLVPGGNVNFSLGSNGFLSTTSGSGGASLPISMGSGSGGGRETTIATGVISGSA